MRGRRAGGRIWRGVSGVVRRRNWGLQRAILGSVSFVFVRHLHNTRR